MTFNFQINYEIFGSCCAFFTDDAHTRLIFHSPSLKKVFTLKILPGCIRECQTYNLNLYTREKRCTQPKGNNWKKGFNRKRERKKFSCIEGAKELSDSYFTHLLYVEHNENRLRF